MVSYVAKPGERPFLEGAAAETAPADSVVRESGHSNDNQDAASELGVRELRRVLF